MIDPPPPPVDRVDFYFDPMCPWAFQASLWIREVRALTGLEITWRFFSLEEINLDEGKPHPWERAWAYGFSPMRVGAYLRRTDMSLLDSWYLAIGHALHEQGRTAFLRETCEEIADELGMPDGLVAAATNDPTTIDDVRADHDHVVGTFGGFGVPTLVFGDAHALFGPVITPAPMGAQALRLWELTTGWLEFPHLYELRKPKAADDLQHIAGQFSTYAATRRWRTVQRPVA